IVRRPGYYSQASSVLPSVKSGGSFLFCDKCGTQVSPDVKFCPSCGAPLATATTAGPTPAVNWTPPAGVKADTGRWISEGWQMVKGDLGNYILIALVFAVINSVVPIIIQGALLVGFHLYCMKRIFNRRAEIGDLFKG